MRFNNSSWSLLYYLIIVEMINPQNKGESNTNDKSKHTWKIKLKKKKNLTVYTSHYLHGCKSISFRSFFFLFFNLSLLMWLCTGDVQLYSHFTLTMLPLSLDLVCILNFNKKFQVDRMTFRMPETRWNEQNENIRNVISFRCCCYCSFFYELWTGKKYFKIARSYSHLYGTSLN